MDYQVYRKGSGTNLHDTEVTDHKKLETMMAQVAQSLVENENHIKEFKAIESFNSQLLKISSETKTVLQYLDDEDNLRKAIAGGYQVLKMKSRDWSRSFRL